MVSVFLFLLFFFNCNAKDTINNLYLVLFANNSIIIINLNVFNKNKNKSDLTFQRLKKFFCCCFCQSSLFFLFKSSLLFCFNVVCVKKRFCGYRYCFAWCGYIKRKKEETTNKKAKHEKHKNKIWW